MSGWDTSELVAFVGFALLVAALVLLVGATDDTPNNDKDE
jgi:hypothetical protein